MSMPFSKPMSYWQHLERIISEKVDAALRWSMEDRWWIIAYLRGFEEMVRGECDRRETTQIIASGRRLLEGPYNAGSIERTRRNPR